MRKIAVTGTLSCGKSSVCRFLRELGARVVSADEIVHQLLSIETSLGQQILSIVGPECVQDGQFNRKRITEVVFTDPEKLQQLEAVLHPAVKERIKMEYAKATEESWPLFVAEIPLLFEAGWEKEFDACVAVTAPHQMRLQRFLNSGPFSEDEFNRRCELQLTQEEKEKRASAVIKNDGSLEKLKEITKHLYQRLIADGE